MDLVQTASSDQYNVGTYKLVTVTRTKANVAASQTDSSIVAAVANKRIRVLAYVIMAGGTATDVTFNTKPGGAGTAISMLHACGINGGICSNYNEGGWFETATGEGLSLTTSAGSTVGIQVTYALYNA